MSRFTKQPPQTVRPRSARKIPVLFCLLMAVLSAWIVYRWGYRSWTPADPNPTYTATAYVIEAVQPQGTGEVPIPIAYTNADPVRAEEVANALADRYVEARRLQWRQRTEGYYLEARETVEGARQELAENEAWLEEFRNEMVGKAAKPQAAEPRKAPMIDNPEWLDLSYQLSELQRRQENLLINRTPLHPAVQSVVMEIEDLQRQMVDTPRQIPGKLPASTDQAELAMTEPIITENDRERLNELDTAVQKSRQMCDEVEAAEQQALASQQTGPQYTVVEAVAVAVMPTSDFDWRRLMVTTLMTGVLMAFGVGTVSAGVNVDPPAGSVGQVRTAACAPVLGTIPADDPVPDPEKLSRNASKKRRALVALGLILIAACPIAAIWGIAGI